MNMSILDDHRKLSILLLLFLLGLVLLFAVLRVRERLAPVPVPATRPLAVETLVLQAAPFVVTRRYTGSVVAAQTTEILARVSSRVVRIHHREGDRVQKGERLISLDDREQRNEISRLQANGKRLQAEFRYWQSQYRRSLKLRREKVISESVYEEALRMKDSLAAAIEENTRALATARLKLEYTRITAPFDARVKKVLTEEGEQTLLYVRPLMELVSAQAMKAVVSVPQVDVGHIHPGMPVQLRLPSLGLWQQTVIAKRYPALDPVTRNGRFEAWFLEQGYEDGRGLQAGMTVDATVVMAEYDAALAIPHQALIDNRLGTGVFVVEKGKARWRKVVAAEVAAGRLRIRQGLQAGEQVIVTPDPRIEDGVLVRVANASVKHGVAP